LCDFLSCKRFLGRSGGSATGNNTGTVTAGINTTTTASTGRVGEAPVALETPAHAVVTAENDDAQAAVAYPILETVAGSAADNMAVEETAIENSPGEDNNGLTPSMLGGVAPNIGETTCTLPYQDTSTPLERTETGNQGDEQTFPGACGPNTRTAEGAAAGAEEASKAPSLILEVSTSCWFKAREKFLTEDGHLWRSFECILTETSTIDVSMDMTTRPLVEIMRVCACALACLARLMPLIPSSCDQTGANRSVVYRMSWTSRSRRFTHEHGQCESHSGNSQRKYGVSSSGSLTWQKPPSRCGPLRAGWILCSWDFPWAV
jgi:hypothetical protein